MNPRVIKEILSEKEWELLNSYIDVDEKEKTTLQDTVIINNLEEYHANDRELGVYLRLQRCIEAQRYSMRSLKYHIKKHEKAIVELKYLQEKIYRFSDSDIKVNLKEVK